MALALQYEEDAYAVTNQSLHPNSAEAEGLEDVQSIVEAKRVDDAVDEDNIDTEVDFRLLGKRKQIDHPHTRPCDVFEIIKLIQTQMDFLQKAWDVSSHAVIENIQSIQSPTRSSKGAREDFGEIASTDYIFCSLVFSGYWATS